MKTVLICGSRQVVQPMLDKVLESVRWGIEHGWHIICGDAGGVDYAVQVAACKLLEPLGQMERLRIYGINDCPRYFCCPDHVETYVQVVGDYLARDRVMVEQADRVIGICLNMSRGTVYTCHYAGKLGKPVGMIHYTTEKTP